MNMIAALRQSMINRDIAATVVPSTDPHGSEYVADHWQARSELSGFDGSAGTLVVTQPSGQTHAILYRQPTNSQALA